MKNQDTVKRNSLINPLLQKHPEVAEILMAYGLHCVGCHFSGLDTVEDGARVHGIPEEDIDMMVKDANKIVEKDNGINVNSKRLKQEVN